MALRSGTFAGFALALACAGCSVAPAPGPEFTSYDFGPAPEKQPAQALRQALVVHEISAPAWLDSAFIHYRLAYVDTTRPRAYADSRWVMSPAALFYDRLRARLAASGSGAIVQPIDGARTHYALRVEMDEFTQVFDAPGKSRGVVRVRAVVVGSRNLVAQRSFSVERPARSADAEGGVRALIAASDEAIDQLIAWMVQQVKE